ncbi:MAG: DUF1275 domain-containing protein [Cryobacterium sp.]|nr:DUF1275 domain-containing protein [Oligoflexia bacterium]
MYRLEREDFVKAPYISLWATLGFQAGFINAFGFLACGRYVSHITGFGTQIGLALAGSKGWLAIELLGFPLSFMVGSFTSGFFTSARLERGEVPWYGPITLILPGILFTLAGLGVAGLFGPFAEGLVEARDFFLLFLLSFACGMQNGCFATLTKGQIRTTHLTGISTDIGSDFARMWFGKLSESEYALTRRTNISRIATFAAFASGSILSVLVSNRFGYAALIVPFLTASFAYLAIRKIHNILDIRFKTVNSLMLAKNTNLMEIVADSF